VTSKSSELQNTNAPPDGRLLLAIDRVDRTKDPFYDSYLQGKHRIQDPHGLEM